MGNALVAPIAPIAPDQNVSQISHSQMRSLLRAGLTPDLALMPYQMPRMTATPILPAPKKRTNISVTNPANFCKDSLETKVIDGKLRIKFAVDTLVPCQATIYFMATEILNEKNVTIRLDSPHWAPATYELKVGSAQVVEISAEHSPSMNILNNYLKPIPEHNFYPFCILLSTKLPDSTTTAADLLQVSPQLLVQQQYTYFAFETKASSSTVTSKYLKQKTHVNGKSYEIQDIYGMGEKGENDDCVICMSASSDTAIFPCRHLCLCSECAAMLRTQTNRCPICRTFVESLLKLEMLSDTNIDTNTLHTHTHTQNDHKTPG